MQLVILKAAATFALGLALIVCPPVALADEGDSGEIAALLERLESEWPSRLPAVSTCCGSMFHRWRNIAQKSGRESTFEGRFWKSGSETMTSGTSRGGDGSFRVIGEYVVPGLARTQLLWNQVHLTSGSREIGFRWFYVFGIEGFGRNVPVGSFIGRVRRGLESAHTSAWRDVEGLLHVGDGQSTMTLAPQYDYQPVRMVTADPGHVTEIVCTYHRVSGVWFPGK